MNRRYLSSALLAVLSPGVLAARQLPEPIDRAGALSAVVAHAPRLGLAVADTAAAAAQLRIARSFENPVLSSGYSRSAPQLHFGLDLPIDYPWVRRDRQAAAASLRQLSQYNLDYTRAQLSLDADTAYTRILAARAHLLLSTRGAIDADSLRRLAVIRRDAGDASDLDVELATVFAGQQRNSAAADSAAVVAALLDLQVLMGLAVDRVMIAPTDSLTANRSWNKLETGGASHFLAAGADELVRAADQNVLLQSHTFGAPTLNAGFETRDPTGGERGILPTFGFSLPFPFFNRNQGLVAAAQAERAHAVTERDLLNLQIRTNADRARRQLGLALSALARDGQLVESANRIASMSLVAYREGASSLANVLDAQRNAREILAQYVDDLAAAWVAKAMLDSNTQAGS